MFFLVNLVTLSIKNKHNLYLFYIIQYDHIDNRNIDKATNDRNPFRSKACIPII